MNAAEFFRALGDEERLRILNLLLRGHGEACVCELVDALRIPQYQVSRQLGVLRGVGLVSGEKRGTWVYYRIAPELPPFHKSVLEGVAAQLQGDAALEDRERFDMRLRLRANGTCVLGYEPNRPFRASIPTDQIAQALP
ncbi:MAG: metalloregulator ArsR/SmtB family transcription factor [Dehalococcoidia bacterium]|nr:metalloregulator ArsR/SmtB family transcription factor [Dehalococcoidia bacterium]